MSRSMIYRCDGDGCDLTQELPERDNPFETAICRYEMTFGDNTRGPWDFCSTCANAMLNKLAGQFPKHRGP